MFAVLLLIYSAGCGEKKDTGDKDTDTLSVKGTASQFPGETIARLDSVLNHAMLEDSIPGVAGGIWIPGKGEWTFTKGVSNIETKSERNLDDIIRIGSITKTFTATVILQLCDEGKIALNDTLDRYFPDAPNSVDITLRMLLDMTSGLRDYLDAPEIENAFFNDRTRKFTDEEIYEIAIKLPTVFKPGEPGQWNYSNTNYLILGMIIKNVTGNSWQDEITTRIINKLGLKNTAVPLSADMPSPYCNGYMKDSVTGEIIDVTVIDPSITGAAGCMISNTGDLRIWVKALSDGTLLSDTMQTERMKLVPTYKMEFMKYGLGILDIAGFTGHNGGITGFNTSMYYWKERDAMFIVNVNMFGPQGGVSDKIFSGLSKVIYNEEVPW
jgi:D-alanyl-D-alanine carboxypeptidase